MKILVFLNSLSLGGTEKAACSWAEDLHSGVDGFDVTVFSLKDGDRRKSLEEAGIEVRIIKPEVSLIKEEIAVLQPDIIHAHCPGYPHEGDILGAALRRLDRKIPVIQTNIFGRLENPEEDAWTDFRLFISWTSCVQAARRAGRKLDLEFFRRQSVAVYPLPCVSQEKQEQLRIAGGVLREKLGVKEDEILFGRFSRPEPNKWTDLPLDGFLKALKKNFKIKLLLREPPSYVAAHIHKSKISGHVLILPTTADPEELQVSQMACDAILHGSSIGESFGYGIAEPMSLGKPVIVNSTPWQDQAQIELVLHELCGFQASTVRSTAKAILRLAENQALRTQMGEQAQKRIECIAYPGESVRQVKNAIRCVLGNVNSQSAEENLREALKVEKMMDQNQFGHSLDEVFSLRLFYYRVYFSKWRKKYLPI